MRVSKYDTYLTPAEMAAKLRISLRSLQRLMKDGKAPPHTKVGGKVLFVLAGEVDHV